MNSGGGIEGLACYVEFLTPENCILVYYKRTGPLTPSLRICNPTRYSEALLFSDAKIRTFSKIPNISPTFLSYAPFSSIISIHHFHLGLTNHAITQTDVHRPSDTFGNNAQSHICHLAIRPCPSVKSDAVISPPLSDRRGCTLLSSSLRSALPLRLSKNFEV